MDRSCRGQSHGLDLSFLSVQKVTFGTLGYGPRAQSVLHCHGVLALRQGPWKSRFGRQFLVSAESNVWLSGLRTAGPIHLNCHGVLVLGLQLGPERSRVQSRFGPQFLGSESNVWHSGLRAAGLIRPSLPWCFSPATGSLEVTVWTSVSCRFRR